MTSSETLLAREATPAETLNTANQEAFAALDEEEERHN